MATATDLALFALFLLVLGAHLRFALAFRTDGDAAAALRVVRQRVERFRWGFIPLLVGIALLAEGQAIKWRAGLPIHHGAVLAFHVAGYALIILGVVVVNVAVWSPRGRAEG